MIGDTGYDYGDIDESILEDAKLYSRMMQDRIRSIMVEMDSHLSRLDPVSITSDYDVDSGSLLTPSAGEEDYARIMTYGVVIAAWQQHDQDADTPINYVTLTDLQPGTPDYVRAGLLQYASGIAE